MGKYIKTVFESFNPKEYNETQRVDEFLGIKKLIKSWLNSFSQPVKKNIEILTKNREDFTNRKIDSKELANSIYHSFDIVGKEAKNDLRNIDSFDRFKEVMKDFLRAIKAVFKSARIPIKGVLSESKEYPILEEIGKFNLVKDLYDLIDGNYKEPEFEEKLESFLNNWINKRSIESKLGAKIEYKKGAEFKYKNEKGEEKEVKLIGGPGPKDGLEQGMVKVKYLDGGQEITIDATNLKSINESLEINEGLLGRLKKLFSSPDNLEKISEEAAEMIDKLIGNLKKKIKGFGPERLQKLTKEASKAKK